MKKIEVNGFVWYWQETEGGNLRLYDAEKDVVTEFDSYKEMLLMLGEVIECGKGAVICKP